jgi:hypothetical protein
MFKKALDFINQEIEDCIMNIKFCRDKGYDSPFHDQRLIDLNNLKEAYEKLLDKTTPRDLELEVYEELCVGCSDEKICHEECEHCVQFYERLEEKENEE